MTCRVRAPAVVTLATVLLAGACGGSGEPDWCRPAGEGLVDLLAVVGTFTSIAQEASDAGLSSDEEFAAFMVDQIAPAIAQLESAGAHMAEAAEQAGDDDVASELTGLSAALDRVAEELAANPAAALGSSDLNDLLSTTSTEIRERCGETLADLAEIPDPSR